MHIDLRIFIVFNKIHALKEELILEIIKKNIIINRPVKCGTTEISTDCDIIVPDVKPDILKILQVDGTAVVRNTELLEGRLLADGIIRLNILYLPDREDEKIKAIETYSEFSTRIDKGEIMPDMQVFVEALVEKIDFQVLNSRKLRVKTTVKIDYEVSEQAMIELAEGIEDEEAEICVTPIELISLVDLKHSSFSVREDFELPPGHSAVEEILKSDVSICDTEYKIVGERAVVKGTLCLSCLYLDTSGCIKSCDFETAFTEIFDLAEADDDTVCDISYFVKDLSLRAEADSDGDMRTLASECEIGVRIVATRKVETEILVDCFYPGKKTEIEKSSAELEKMVSSGFYQTTVREIVSAPAACPNILGIYNVFATLNVEKTEVLNNSVCVSGNVSCCILYISDSEETPVYSMKKNFPFNMTIDTPGSESSMDCCIDVKLVHTSFSLNPANEAEIRSILSASARVFERNNVEIIDEIFISEPDENQVKGIVLYFVQKNESLWDISKRYFVSQKEILSVNNLEDDAVIKEGMRLLIPTA